MFATASLFFKSNSVFMLRQLSKKPMFNFGQSILKLRREKQSQLAQKIKKGLQASYVSVTDTTIGTSSCGQMYNIVVESPLFEGKNKVQQQRLVNEVIAQEIKNIHGYSLKTRSPKKVVQQKKNQQTKQAKDQNKKEQTTKKQ